MNTDQPGEATMKIIEGIYVRLEEQHEFGKLTLARVEINPRSGPPDCFIRAFPGIAWLEDVSEAQKGWKPEPHQETEFGLFLLSPRRDILLWFVSGNPAQVEHDAEWMCTALEPLSSLEARFAARWENVGKQCMDYHDDWDDRQTATDRIKTKRTRLNHRHAPARTGPAGKVISLVSRSKEQSRE